MNKTNLYYHLKFFCKKILRFIYSFSVFHPLFNMFEKVQVISIKLNHIVQEPVRFKENNRLLSILASELVVKNGIFKGMKYPDARSAGSSLLPKILGSYESELSPVFNKILNRDYSEIIDIGSAEGYYAIGLAMKFPNAICYAYDTSPDARAMCNDMAILNSVNNRVDIRGDCSPESLLSVPLRDRALVISDCEGYEKILFTEEVFKRFENHDILIECHDMFDIEITPTLKARASHTHNCTIIDSLDDIQKARKYSFPELQNIDTETKYLILREGRATIMQWLFFEPTT